MKLTVKKDLLKQIDINQAKKLFGNSIPMDATTDEVVESIIKYFNNNDNFVKIIKQ